VETLNNSVNLRDGGVQWRPSIRASVKYTGNKVNSAITADYVLLNVLF